jgi:hypothetical protein
VFVCSWLRIVVHNTGYLRLVCGTNLAQAVGILDEKIFKLGVRAQELGAVVFQLLLNFDQQFLKIRIAMETLKILVL